MKTKGDSPVSASEHVLNDGWISLTLCCDDGQDMPNTWRGPGQRAGLLLAPEDLRLLEIIDP